MRGKGVCGGDRLIGRFAISIIILLASTIRISYNRSRSITSRICSIISSSVDIRSKTSLSYIARI